MIRKIQRMGRVKLSKECFIFSLLFALPVCLFSFLALSNHYVYNISIKVDWKVVAFLINYMFSIYFILFYFYPFSTIPVLIYDINMLKNPINLTGIEIYAVNGLDVY